MNPEQLEGAYQEYIKNVHALPDGIRQIDLELLANLGLLKISEFENPQSDAFEQHFTVIESEAKVTLYNDKLALWITPEHHREIPSTLAMVALIKDGKTSLEMALRAESVFNTPKHILHVLQTTISDLLETENAIKSLDTGQSSA